MTLLLLRNRTKDVRNDVAEHHPLQTRNVKQPSTFPKDHVENDGGFTSYQLHANADAITGYLVNYIQRTS